jgi:hypothetical protein
MEKKEETVELNIKTKNLALENKRKEKKSNRVKHY